MEEDLFVQVSKEILNHNNYLILKEHIQHGKTSVYEHSYNVAYTCYLKNKNKKNIDLVSLIRGALLHDYFRYDWHESRKKTSRKGLHGFKHPLIALINAKKDFTLNKKEKNIIRSHMWPLTLFHIPLCKEAWIVCYYDKIISFKETFSKK